jgi:hypothetical protein
MSATGQVCEILVLELAAEHFRPNRGGPSPSMSNFPTIGVDGECRETRRGIERRHERGAEVVCASEEDGIV